MSDNKFTRNDLTTYGKCLIDEHWNTNLKKVLKSRPGTAAFEAEKKGFIDIKERGVGGDEAQLLKSKADPLQQQTTAHQYTRAFGGTCSISASSGCMCTGR